VSPPTPAPSIPPTSPPTTEIPTLLGLQFDEEVGSNDSDEEVGSNDAVDVEDEATDAPTGTDAPIVVISVPLLYDEVEDVPSNDP
jgi:hypothetical protein